MSLSYLIFLLNLLNFGRGEKSYSVNHIHLAQCGNGNSHFKQNAQFSLFTSFLLFLPKMVFDI